MLPSPLTPLPLAGEGNKNLFSTGIKEAAQGVATRLPSPTSGRGCPKGGRGKSWLLAFVFSGFNGIVLAADGAIHPASSNPSAALGQMLLGLLAVLGLIATLTYLLKRLPRSRVPRGHIRLIESYPLSTRERLLLVAIGNEQILLAVSSAGIAPLHVLREPLEQSAGSNPSNAFAAHLSQFLPGLQRGRT